jgi:hypothetical protein
MLETEVVVEMTREVFLNAEEAVRFLCSRFANGLGRARRLGGFLEISFLFVLF